MYVAGQTTVALQAELAAMQQVALILGALDPAARVRVLQWAAQRVQDDSPQSLVVPATPPKPLSAVSRVGPEPAVIDEALSVTTLEELFRPVAARTPAPAEPTSQPVIGLLHDFVVEFQNIARDWNVAVADPADRAADQRASSAA
jgi:hypothetical protein